MPTNNEKGCRAERRFDENWNSQFANSLEVFRGSMTQEISRGMGADVAPTSVPQTPLASLIFLNSRERENKALRWECNGLVTRHRGHCAYTRTASSPHRAREHQSPRCTSRRHASVRDLAHVKHAASRHRERVPIDASLLTLRR